MITAVLVNFVNLFVFAFNILILARVVWSWINPHPEGGIGGLLFEITEPLLAPLRRILPGNYGLDFSPLVAFLVLQLIAEVVNRAFPT